MQSPLPDFSRHRVLVVGDVMLDRYWHGSTLRISPEAPVPVVKIDGEESRAGGAGNVALNVAALGAKAVLAGLTGTDEAGRTLAALLAGKGIDSHLVACPQARTITKLRVISRQQQLIRLDFEGCFTPEQADLVLTASQAACSEVGVAILSDYAKGTLGRAQSLIRQLRARGLPVIVDPKGSDFERYRGATLLTPNMSEFEAVAGACRDDAVLVKRAEALREHLELDALVITRSEHGMTLVERGKPGCHLPTRAREVYDVTGAGDTVTGVLGCGLAAGLTLREATALANAAAGVVVGKLGTATASPTEIAHALAGH